MIRRSIAITGLALICLVQSLSAHAAPADTQGAAHSELFTVAIDLNQATAAGHRVEVQGDTAVLLDGGTGQQLAAVPVARLYATRAEVEAAASGGQLDIEPARGGGGATTNGVVYGSCGASYLYMRDGGANDNDFEFTTGFDLNRDAFDFNWLVVFDGPGGFGSSWGDTGPLFPDQNWTSGWRSEYSGSNGTHVGEVNIGVAFATNGTICYSGGPAASAYAS